MDLPKRGDRFIHARFLNKNNKPEICEVTAVRKVGIDTRIYHKNVGGSKGSSFFLLKNIDASVKRWLPTNEA